MTQDGSTAGAGQVLVVCTGNVCRSPYMERRLAQALDGSGVIVASAGTGALVGQPIDPDSASLLSSVGARTDNYVARQVTPQIIGEADLVLAAARSHRGEIVQMYPKALRFAFTWGDFADLVADLHPAGIGLPEAGESWVAHVASVAASRRGTVPPRPKKESDIIDPYRQDSQVFEAMAEAIENDLPAIVNILTPPLRG
ncbi:protein tyrosine phosphatase [Intrasporangium chromatireducens Q5-1]|uniref:Protein tyrosine phosphatase n=1 Tax=Intrasporangium chromatireducens Q5-1 TaxID=584657 RepID=W9GLJ8_9MICO|nr:low molecular weight phosphatase family protein [Intrasporangium chromatireducens]EWT06970.1 protein tyrosine phosphatase [Intrasporangium chromatireducens Q5-1]